MNRWITAAAVAMLLMSEAQARSTTLTFDQPSGDCPSVASWDVFNAPVTPTNSNPAFPGGTPAASALNTAPVVCGAGAKITVTVACPIGLTRWWIRAVSNTTPVQVSGPSNPIDAACPLTPPTLRAVQP